ncbi:MAG TPA: IS4 family transposase [Vicinamibacterales bacterium]|nr:IS4 family transposase [Vicinamibacterales bacterium]
MAKRAVGRAPSRTGFLGEWDALVGRRGVPAVPPRRGRPARVPLGDLLAALTFHVMQGAGSLGEHFDRLCPDALSDSAAAERRARLPWAIFASLMQRVLRPKATRRQPTAFWRGWRVVALDGTQFNLTNAPQMRPPVPKARTRRGRAAFGKLTTAVLLEVGLHNPVAAAIGRAGESEWALAQRLLAHLPKRALLLGDRLYGVAAFVVHAQAACQRVGSHFLLRASRVTKPRVRRRLSDGTRLIAIALRARERPHPIVDWLEVREIRVRVARAGHRAHAVRLWTSLLDPDTAPALELARLYAQRWEHELYFRELKRAVRRTDLLQSHTLETAAQEIAALVLASAILAAQRTRVAGALPPMRISFAKLLDLGVRPMWLAVDLTEDIVSEAQLRRILQRGYARLRQYVTPARRPRTCPRAIRQPTRAWPRLLHPQSTTGEWTITLAP